MEGRTCKWIVTALVVIVLLIVSGILFMLGTDLFKTWSWNAYTISGVVVGVAAILVLIGVGIEDGTRAEEGKKAFSFKRAKEAGQYSRVAAQKLAECIAENPKLANRAADLLERRDHPKLAKYVRELPKYSSEYNKAAGEIPKETIDALEASDSSLIQGLTRATSKLSCARRVDKEEGQKSCPFSSRSETSPLY